MNRKYKFVFVASISLILSSTISIELDAFFLNTFYTVSGIMFSIGIGLVVTFNLQGIKNKSYIDEIRKNLNYVRNSYIQYFSLTTICFIIDNYLRTENIDTTLKFSNKFSLPFNVQLFFFMIILYSIGYFIVNFLELQKLNNDIFDRMLE